MLAQILIECQQDQVAFAILIALAITATFDHPRSAFSLESRRSTRLCIQGWTLGAQIALLNIS